MVDTSKIKFMKSKELICFYSFSSSFVDFFIEIITLRL